MSEEIKEITSSLKEILNKYPNRQLEILLYVFGRDNLMNMINEPTYEELKQENQKKLYTSNGNKFTKYELLDDYEGILQENRQLKTDLQEANDNATWWNNRFNAVSKENQQLLETSKAYKKLLKTTMQKEHQAIKVLDEIRELLNKNYISSYSYDFEIFKNNLLQILDKVDNGAPNE